MEHIFITNLVCLQSLRFTPQKLPVMLHHNTQPLATDTIHNLKVRPHIKYIAFSNLLIDTVDFHFDMMSLNIIRVSFDIHTFKSVPFMQCCTTYIYINIDIFLELRISNSQHSPLLQSSQTTLITQVFLNFFNDKFCMKWYRISMCLVPPCYMGDQPRLQQIVCPLI